MRIQACKPRLSARRKRIMERDETIYRTLRNYQDGLYGGRTSGVVVGRLDIALSTVYDKIVEAANKA